MRGSLLAWSLGAVALFAVGGWTLVVLTSAPGPVALPAPPARDSGPVPVVFYHYFSGTLAGGVGDMVAGVNARQSAVRIDARAIDHEAYKGMIRGAVAGTRPPELFAYWAGERVRALVERGDLAPLDGLWDRLRCAERFPPVLESAACTYGGSRYLLPLDQHAVVVFYDARRFAALGLAPPRTWAAFTAACDAVAAAGVTPLALGARERWPAQFWFDYLLLRTAGPAYRERLMRGEAAWTDPEVVRACGLWTDLLRTGRFNADAARLDWAEATDLVCRGRAAMTLMGTWALQSFTRPDLGLAAGRDYDFFPFPEVDAGVPRAMVGPIDGVVLSARSANRAAAEEALVLLATPAAQAAMSKGAGALPAGPGDPAPGTGLLERIKAESDACAHWAFNFDLATAPAAAEIGLDALSEMIAFPEQLPDILAHAEREVRAAAPAAGRAAP